MPYEEQRDKEKLRKLYMAYANITRDVDKAKFLTAQTIQESGWGMKESGKNNFSGVKELDKTKGSMVKTSEDLEAYTHKDKKRILSDEEGLLKLTDDISKRGGSIIYDKNGLPEKDKKGYIYVMDRFKDYDTVEEGLRFKVEMIERKYNKAYNAKTIEGYVKGLEGYATDSDYFKGVSGVATGKTLNKKVLGDLVETTRQNLKNTRMESFKAQDNLSKLVNANPAQMEQYHKGVMDKERFARQSVAGGDGNIDYSVLGNIRQTSDYYEFEADIMSEIPLFGNAKGSVGITTYRHKEGGTDPDTRLRASFTKELDPDTSITVHGSKNKETSQLGFQFTSKY